jgi:dephospho-CoA kinase
MRASVPVVGVVGGIASGKSFITEQLKRQGAVVISADQLAHEVLRFPEIKNAVREHWGERVFSGDGEVNRQALGQIVFSPPPDGPRELKILEQLTHPRIATIIREQMEALREQATATAVVLDVPLLIESGWNKFCDRIMYVDAPRELRVARAAARGWTEEDFARREATQESLETKRKLADVVIDNSGSPESAQAQIEHFWRSLGGCPQR